MNFAQYFSDISISIQSVPEDKLIQLIDLLERTVNDEGTIWIAGNGGSASTASHFATDLSRCVSKSGKTAKAFSLTDNTSLITAIGNDFGYEKIFEKQIEYYGSKGDLLIVISASGNSKNLISAVEKANEKNIMTIGFLGFDGGILSSKVDNLIHAATSNGAYGQSEDSHSIICHFVALTLREKLK